METDIFDDELISVAEAGKIMGDYPYATAYKKIFIDKLVSHHDGGDRDKKVYKKSAIAYREAHRVKGIY